MALEGTHLESPEKQLALTPAVEGRNELTGGRE